jgi:S-adenosyl-L-methionine hydrolase (adenosine-forming)
LTSHKEKIFDSVIKNILSAQYQQMSVIGLLTDWKNSDFYLGALKGKLMGLCPDHAVVDICHTISVHNVFQAAFVLKHCIEALPENSVFIIGVRSYALPEEGYLCAAFKNRFILCADNGLIPLVTSDESLPVIRLPYIKTTFPEADIFAPAAALVLAGNPIETIGTPDSMNVVKKNFFPSVDKNSITGTVMFVDNYGNSISNISRELFEKVRNGRKFILYPGNKDIKIKEISDGYFTDEEAGMLAVFNSIDLMEIGSLFQQASEFINLVVNTNIRIQFYDT